MDTSKIIIGTVGGGRYTVTAPIVKEDHGLYLQIEGVELPDTCGHCGIFCGKAEVTEN